MSGWFNEEDLFFFLLSISIVLLWQKLSKNNGNGCFDQNNHYRMYLYYIMECMYHILWSINHAISFILMPFNFAIFFTNYLNLICRLQNSSDWEYGCNSGIYVYYIDTK